MKKIIVLLFMAFITTTVCNAQIYFGGQVNIRTTSESEKTGSNTSIDESTFGFTLAPRVGYQFDEKMSAGLGFSIGMGTTTDKSNPATTIKTKNMNWNITPFLRYSFVEFGNFSVMAEGRIGIGGRSSSTKTGNVTVDNPSTFNFGINITPMISYKISENINLEAALNFCNIGFNTSTRTTTPVSGDKTKHKNSDFTIGANTNDVVTLGNITVGFIYKL